MHIHSSPSPLVRLWVFALCLAFPDRQRSCRKNDDDLAKKAQNPIASMISLPIDTSIDFGASNGIAVVSNIQPVIPANLGEWNLVSRFILPVAYVEGAVGSLPSIPEIPKLPSDEVFGLGDLNYTGFFSPAKAESVIWGVGPSIMFPSATDPLLGSEKWSAVLELGCPRPAQAAWRLRPPYPPALVIRRRLRPLQRNQTMFQYFINYNLDNGWYLITDPVILANWGAPSSNR